MLEEINEYFLENKIPKFRFTQLEKAVYEQFISCFDEITVYPKSLREELDKKFSLNSLILVDSHKSIDSVKFVFKTFDGYFIESVLMFHNDGRRTVCVSCQIFCAVGCRFCATGANDFKRSLNLNEIIEQVLFIERYLKNKASQNFKFSEGLGIVSEKKNSLNEKVSNIVYMGMGEPFLNFENVVESIKIFKEKIGIGAKHITVSTCGIIDKIKEFTDLNLKVRLAISLHASNDKLRSELMPINDKYPLADLMKACNYFNKKTNKRISYEYVLIKDVNDKISQAVELSNLLKGKLAHVNLLIYNPHEFAKFEKPTKENVLNFKKVLEENGMEVSIRKSLGDDIGGACGQLSGKKNKR